MCWVFTFSFSVNSARSMVPLNLYNIYRPCVIIINVRILWPLLVYIFKSQDQVFIFHYLFQPLCRITSIYSLLWTTAGHLIRDFLRYDIFSQDDLSNFNFLIIMHLQPFWLSVTHHSDRQPPLLGFFVVMCLYHIHAMLLRLQL